MLDFPFLFDTDAFWGSDKSISVKIIQISLNKLDLEDFASYRIYVNVKEPFVKYLHSDNPVHSLSLAKSSEGNSISSCTDECSEKRLESFISNMKTKCSNISKKENINYAYFIFLRQKEENQKVQQCVCYCFLTKEKFGVFELAILENIAMIINHTIFEVAYKKELLKECIKSTISAIMARNMSHNLGSHFIPNTKHYFNNLAEIDKDKQRQKDYRGIRHTLQYIQERMDFIATIVSTDHFPYGPVNVKSQIFDELTPDEFGDRHQKATTNFLLDYIVFSENISKQSNISKSGIKLSLELITEGGERFGGNKTENEDTKHNIAKINFAVPGGILGRHAIFTIIENIIRNSSKHDKSQIPQEGLKISIKIGENYIIIFDNKNNAKNGTKPNLIENITERYEKIKILSDGAIDKSNKGLKEILISALWLNNIPLAEWFGEYDAIVPNKIVPNEKINKLSEVLRIVAVDNNGNEVSDGNNLGYFVHLDQYEQKHNINEKYVKEGRIAYSDICNIKADIITAKDDYEVVMEGSSDSKQLKLSDIYPRFYKTDDTNKSPESVMKKIIARNLNISKETLRKIKIHIDTLKKDSCDVKNCAWHNGTLTIEQIEQGDILFKSHLSIIDSPEGTARVLDYFKNAAYIDSISGGDFTGILTRSFFLQDELNRLKVIESALTEFAIIDERIYKNYGKGGAAVVRDIEENKGPEPTVDEVYAEIKKLLENNTEKGEIRKHILQTFELDLIARRLVADNETEIKQEITSTIQQKHDRNKQETENTISNNAEINKNKVFHQMLKQRRLYIYDIDKNGDIIDLDGKTVVNILHAGDNKAICSPMFVSIHLSIIEKIIKETGLLALDVMAGLKKVFGGTKFITIHSGRGNLSADLEKDLKDYAFLSLSAVQAAMDDSKYFLSQLLYNNCYIGKGRINHK